MHRVLVYLADGRMVELNYGSPVTLLLQRYAERRPDTVSPIVGAVHQWKSGNNFRAELLVPRSDSYHFEFKCSRRYDCPGTSRHVAEVLLDSGFTHLEVARIENMSAVAELMRTLRQLWFIHEDGQRVEVAYNSKIGQALAEYEKSLADGHSSAVGAIERLLDARTDDRRLCRLHIRTAECSVRSAKAFAASDSLEDKAISLLDSRFMPEDAARLGLDEELIREMEMWAEAL